MCWSCNRIFALTKTTVTPYQGNPLDPPLRSRFQSHFVGQRTLESSIELLKSLFPKVPSESIKNLCAFAESLKQAEDMLPELDSTKNRLLDFPGMPITVSCGYI